MDYTKSRELDKNPRENASCLSHACFWYVFSLKLAEFAYCKTILFHSWVFSAFRTARNPDYNPDDLYKPLKSHQSDFLGQSLSEKWEKELSMAKTKNKKPNLLRALFRVFASEYILFGLSLFVMEFLLR